MLAELKCWSCSSVAGPGSGDFIRCAKITTLSWVLLLLHIFKVCTEQHLPLPMLLLVCAGGKSLLFCILISFAANNSTAHLTILTCAGLLACLPWSFSDEDDDGGSVQGQGCCFLGAMAFSLNLDAYRKCLNYS